MPPGAIVEVPCSGYFPFRKRASFYLKELTPCRRRHAGASWLLAEYNELYHMFVTGANWVNLCYSYLAHSSSLCEDMGTLQARISWHYMNVPVVAI
jgi:hypothetical protein